MALALVGLHGFTLNGAVMRTTLAPLIARLPSDVNVTCPDGPNTCSDSSVARMQQLFGGATHQPGPPHRCWFDASDDGRQYHGFEHTKRELAALIEAQAQPTALIGFSQGAAAAACLAALSAHQRFPALTCVVLIAGRVPRSDEIAPLLDAPLSIPSLHVWGLRDPLALPHAQSLVGRFDLNTRQTVTWPGSHTIPTRGDAADVIVQFISEHATRHR